MVEALKDLAKRAFANSFLDLESVCNMVVDVADILPFVVVETPIFGTVWSCQNFPTVLALQNVKVEDLIILKNLSFLIVKEVLGQVIDDFTRFHRELNLKGSLLLVVQNCLPRNGRV